MIAKNVRRNNAQRQNGKEVDRAAIYNLEPEKQKRIRAHWLTQKRPRQDRHQSSKMLSRYADEERARRLEPEPRPLEGNAPPLPLTSDTHTSPRHRGNDGVLPSTQIAGGQCSAIAAEMRRPKQQTAKTRTPRHPTLTPAGAHRPSDRVQSLRGAAESYRDRLAGCKRGAPAPETTSAPIPERWSSACSALRRSRPPPPAP